MSNPITYKYGYKYQLKKDYELKKKAILSIFEIIMIFLDHLNHLIQAEF